MSSRIGGQPIMNETTGLNCDLDIRVILSIALIEPPETHSLTFSRGHPIRDEPSNQRRSSHGWMDEVPIVVLQVGRAHFH